MRPPICAICNNRFPSTEGGLISFKLTDDDKEFNKKFKNPGFVGHPKGREWFCGKHVDLARKYKDLTWGEAKEKMMAE